jgi:hypothetical protein
MMLKFTNEIANAGNVLHKYYGEGSLSKAFFGFAIEPVKNISVGANLNYLFGMLNKNSETFFLTAPGFYNNQKFESLRLSDFSLSLGNPGNLPA